MSDNDVRMSFTEHLGELRARLIRIAIGVAVGFALSYTFSNQLFEIVAGPLRALDESNSANAIWTTLNPLEGFLVKLKLAVYSALIVSLPFTLYQVGAFVFPGLKPRERRAVWWLLTGCTALAVSGLCVAYFGVLPLVLPYILQWVPEGVQVQFRMNETVSMLLKGLLGFALAFQFPMVVLILVYLELLGPDALRRNRRIAIIGIAVVSAVFTPPDVLSMIILMTPLALLYEISIWASYLIVRRRKAEEASNQPHEDAKP